jgi:hypothetical protein
MPPNIYHNNGRFRIFLDKKRLKLNLGPAFFLQLERQMRQESPLKQQLRKPADLDIVLCTTRPEKQYTESILEYLGIDDFVVLGRQLETWKHIYKIELIVDHIKKNPEPGLLLHLDAPDVLVTGDLQNAVDCFTSNFDCAILFGAEKCSAPVSSNSPEITESETKFLTAIEAFEESNYRPPFQYLNAGCFIGRKETILQLFNEVLQTSKQLQLSSRLYGGDFMYEDDQLMLRELHRNHYPRVQIDHQNKVFQNLHAIRRSEISCGQPLPGGIGFLAAYFRYMKIIARGKIKQRLGV